MAERGDTVGFANEVPESVNLAIALRYDNAEMSAPTLLAKGEGEVGERIKKLARKHNIPIVENGELAQDIFKMVRIGNEIPSMLYQTVADVLAYIYRSKNQDK